MEQNRHSSPMNPVFHDGELYLQGLLGKENVTHAHDLGSEKIHKNISHDGQNFIEQRHMCIVASWDETTYEVWCTPMFASTKKGVDVPQKRIVSQENRDPSDPLCKAWDSCHVTPSDVSFFSHHRFPQFQKLVHCQNECQIKINAVPMPGDPAWNNLKKGAWISVNYIELETRKRFRTNGKMLEDISEHGIVYENDESFTTCPKYIQQRRREIPKTPRKQSSTKTSTTPDLDERGINLISHADTFFIATVSPKHGADSSHRGGRKGFCRIAEKSILCWGDYLGKNMFQTLGNTVQNPAAGLAFLDFTTGDILQLTGHISIQTLGDQLALDNCSRNIVFTIKSWRFTEQVAPFEWKLIAPSSHNPYLKDQKVKVDSTEVETTSPMEKIENDGVDIIAIKKQSESVKTFKLRLEREIDITPGQYATFAFSIDNIYYQRCWTVEPVKESLDQCDKQNRTNTIEIAVKVKEGGAISPWLWNRSVGTKFKFLGFEGAFTLETSRNIVSSKGQDSNNDWKLFYLTAGIGLTPAIAMMRGLIHSIKTGKAHQLYSKQIQWIHSDKTVDSLPFIDDLHEFIKFGIDIHFAITNGGDEDVKRMETLFPESQVKFSRVDKDYINVVCPDLKSRITYFCGPPGFMKHMINRLDELGVCDDQILSESFEY